MNPEKYYAKKAKYYDIANSVRYRELEDELRFFKWIFKKFNKKVKRILDIGCGTGRLSIPLSEMGYKVVGIDTSKEMLDIAQGKVKKGNKNVFFKKTDMRNYKLKDKFDFIVNGDSSITHLLTRKDVMKTLRNIYSHLSEDGILILDVLNYVDWKGLRPTVRWTEKKGKVKVASARHHKLDSKDFYSWTETLKVTEKGRLHTFQISSKLKLWRQKEWLRMLKDTRFKRIERYSSAKHRKQSTGTPKKLYFVVQK